MDDTPPVPTPGGRGARKPIPLSGWKIRFDSPPKGLIARRAETGDILALFRAWHEVDREGETLERRLAPRYTPATTRAWLGWWNRGSFRVVNAEIINLSKGGALMQLEARPPSSQPVWLCLGTPYPIDFVQARVLGAEGKTDEPSFARLEFHTPCPPSFFLAAGFREEEEVTD